eukprot:TRINITY_DN3715_c0_g1_i11.p1 TRINITY_DN3715_c0_g1~~TRINITY_DN3715_c0_g1_i11.p1  ORF type:complete len:401 (-),score=72.80 TRINITY_DN3715_c0_g1_i11:87-1289(-)
MSQPRLNPIVRIASCGQVCGAVLTCGHLCKAKCHPDTAKCPSQICNELVTVSCACARISKQVPCSSAKNALTMETQVLLCDGQCAIEDRNRRFREALNITTNGQASKTRFIPYTKSLLEQASPNLDLVVRMEKTLQQLVVDHGSVNLPPMNRAQRSLVHQMASHYFVDSEAHDPEPRRSIRLTKTSRSTIPMTLLSQAVQWYRSQPHNVQTAENWPPRCVLHMYDFAHEMKTRDLHKFLAPWEGAYTLNWVDDNNVMVVFVDADSRQSALRGINTLGLFRVKGAEDSVDATAKVRAAVVSSLASPNPNPSVKQAPPLTASLLQGDAWTDSDVETQNDINRPEHWDDEDKTDVAKPRWSATSANLNNSSTKTVNVSSFSSISQNPFALLEDENDVSTSTQE